MNGQVAFHRIKMLCDSKGISITKLESELNFGVSTIAKWRTGGAPSIDKIVKVAKYFNVSVDYLLGQSDISSSADDILKDKDIVTMQRAAEQMSEDEKDRMYQMVRIGFKSFFDKIEEEDD